MQGFKQVSNIIISAFLNDHVSFYMKNDFEGSKNGYWVASEEVMAKLQIRDDGGNRNKTKQNKIEVRCMLSVKLALTRPFLNVGLTQRKMLRVTP